MRTFTRLFTAACTGLLTASALAGDLTPPAGPIEPTMLPLDHAVPSSPITRADVPIIIDAPGAYHLVENLDAGPGDAESICIQIDVPGVVLDLAGFRIGAQDPATRWDTGVFINTTADNAVVRNGAAIECDSGFHSVAPSGATFEDCAAQGNASSGFLLEGASLVARCRATDNGQLGFAMGVQSVLTNCVATGNNFIGININKGGRIVDCVVSGNQGAGISVNTVSEDGAAVISGCIIDRNTGDGIEGGAALIIDCSITNSGAAGVDVTSSTIRGCAVAHSAGHGIDAAGDSVITNNTCDNNAGAGIRTTAGARIEGNHASNNAIGIQTATGASLVIGNTLSNNGAGLDLSPETKAGATSLDPATAGPLDNLQL